MKSTYNYLLIFFFLFTSIQNYAQCDEISQLNGGNSYPVANERPLAGNTFLATCTGTLHQLTIKTFSINGDPDLPVELKIYKDLLGSNPVLLQELNESLPTDSGGGYRTFSIDVDVVEGETYAWALKKNPDQIAIVLRRSPITTDVYPDGRSFMEAADDPGNYIRIPGFPRSDWFFKLDYLDETAPVAICQDISKNLESDNTVSILPSEIDNGSYDDQSGIVSYTLSQDTFDCSNVGDNLVTLTVEDASGNTDTCTATVTIVDTVSPTLTCPADITVTAVPGTPTIVTYEDVIATEECALPTSSGLSYLGSWNGFSYYLSEAFIPSSVAFSVAETLNLNLATITSQEQNDALVSALNGVEAWIGYTDRTVEGNFEWHSGSTATYTNWNPTNGSPNGGGSEDYVQINSSGTWDDLPNTFARRFILELPSPIIQTEGLPSGSEFPVGETTNSFQITDASGNVGTCSFTVTVEQAPETEVLLSAGTLFIADIGTDSNDQFVFTQSADANTLTISNLNAPVQVSSGVTVIDDTTVSVPVTSITTDILVVADFAGNAAFSDSITITNGLDLAGTNNDLTISGITDFTQTGTMNIGGGLFIHGNPGGTISLATMNVQGQLNINNVDAITQTTGPIAISGFTNLQSQTSIGLNNGSFGGAITLESETLDFRATSGDLTFNTVTATGTDVTNNNYLYAAGDINFTDTVQTAGDSNMTLRGNIVQQSSSGIITTNELVIEGNSFATSAFVLDQAMNDVNKITSNTTNHRTSGILLNDINDVEIGVVNTGAIYADANTITFSDTSNLMLVFDGVLDGTMNLTATNPSAPAQINHNGGTLTLRGTSSYLFSGAFQYTAVASATLQITNAEVLIDTPDHIQTFGRLHMSLESFAVAAGSTVNILDIGDFKSNGASLRGDGTINGNVAFSSSATLKPGTETTTGHLTINGDIKLFSTSTNTNAFPSFAPLIESDTSFDTVNLSGTIDLEDAKFEPTGDFTVIDGTQEIVLIQNDGTDPIVGTFHGLPEGASFDFGGFSGVISYIGGDGNDLVLVSDILVSPKVYLQGASIEANVGEESLMRDDLRVNGLFPLSTPYSDGLTIDASILTTNGPDAIVDWVWVSLVPDSDSVAPPLPGPLVGNAKSALIQRDGDVVDIDGVSPLSFDIAEDNYYVVVEHRNHLNIRSASTVALSRTVTEVDLSSDPSMVNGGANSVLLLSNGYYGMYTGDFDGNAQIQNTDANAVIQLIGGAGYEDADMDINAEIQNTDVNALISPNMGRGEQFGRPGIATELLSSDVTVAFANAQITDDGVDNYYEADIVISGTTDFYIGSGQVYLEYNTAAFGENVATNNSIAYSQPDGSILSYSFGAFSPAYRDFVQNDNTTSRVSLSFQQNIGLAGLETAPELQITSTPKVLFHIKIRYVDSSADADICFYSEGVFQDQFFTACGGTATADCTNTPGVQITNDTYDCSEAGVGTLSITSLESEQILLYPNPTSSSFSIKGLTTTSQIRIYDVNGRLILEEQRSDDRPIDMDRYENGVYLVEIQGEYGTHLKRLIKK
ncbi:T9SS type A sorting domain-containing protein [Winogradskyella sp.]|uniref:T9SS type A sorting domain-containing protein n=1 Tax=Winogradskyella sp. TaxID=1883156 RepID=UPI003BAA36D9